MGGSQEACNRLTVRKVNYGYLVCDFVIFLILIRPAIGNTTNGGEKDAPYNQRSFFTL